MVFSAVSLFRSDGESKNIRVDNRWMYAVSPTQDIKSSEKVFFEDLQNSKIKPELAWYSVNGLLKTTSENRFLVPFSATENETIILETGARRTIRWSSTEEATDSRVTLKKGEYASIYVNAEDEIDEMVLSVSASGLLALEGSRACVIRKKDTNRPILCKENNTPSNGSRSMVHTVSDELLPGDIVVVIMKLLELQAQLQQSP